MKRHPTADGSTPRTSCRMIGPSAFCDRCGRPLWEHDKQRVSDNGQYWYERRCDDGERMDGRPTEREQSP